MKLPIDKLKLNPNNPRLIKRCNFCGQEYYNKNKSAKFCSLKCFGQTLRILKYCKQCDSIIDGGGAAIKNRVFCSRKCFGESIRGRALSPQWRLALSEGRKKSEKCKGPNLYNWKGGKTTLAERMKIHAHKRRSSQKIAIDKVFLDNLYRAQRGCCFYCNERLKYKAIEHLTPLSRGGDNQKYNLVYSCKSCNSKKHNKTMEEYAIQTGNFWWIDKFDVIYPGALYGV